jgi:hypothetical protein
VLVTWRNAIAFSNITPNFSKLAYHPTTASPIDKRVAAQLPARRGDPFGVFVSISPISKLSRSALGHSSHTLTDLILRSPNWALCCKRK